MYDFGLVMTCKNAADTIDESIFSVASQVGGNTIRFHIQDALSTDNTLSKIQEWEKRINDSTNDYLSKIIFSYTSQQDSGMYEGIHNAFEFISPQPENFIGWLNADDIIFPNTVKTLVKLAKNVPEVLWVTGHKTAIDEQGSIFYYKSNHVFPQAILKNGLADGIHWSFIQQESTFWRYSLYKSVGGLNTQLKRAGDWDLWRRFANHAQCFHLQRQLGAWRKRSDQLSSEIDKYWAEIDGIVSEKERAEHKLHVFSAPLSRHTVMKIKEKEHGSFEVFNEPLTKRNIDTCMKNVKCKGAPIPHKNIQSKKKERVVYITLLNFLPILKITESHSHKHWHLFGLLPILMKAENQTTKRYYLFNKIPLITTHKKEEK